jgi:LysR family glycine cleavage system transcriptional activator
MDTAVRTIRQSAGRKCVHQHLGLVCIHVADPPAGGLSGEHPDIDIRIDATDTSVDLDTSDVDLALRYCVPTKAPAHASACLASS